MRFELQAGDGRLAFQRVTMRAELDLSEASGGEVEGRLVLDVGTDFHATDHGARITVARPRTSGRPITTAVELGELFDGRPGGS